MNELRFDGKVALVTGAGRGLGRAHALLLASRGAHVVVNDLGGHFDGTGADAGPAHEVVREITELGGSAVANTASVTETDGAESMVNDAITAFGQLDIVVSNAGIIVYEPFPSSPVDAFTKVLGVHLVGSYNVMRAAWPHLLASRSGRAVLTTSAGAFGSARVMGYSSAKGAIISLGRSLAQAGREHGIKVNLLAPSAVTRTKAKDPRIRQEVGHNKDPYELGRNGPEEVSPLVAVLVHERCPATGEIFASNGVNVSRVFWAETRGYTHSAELSADELRAGWGSAKAGLTPEIILDNWDKVTDESGYYVPTDVKDYAGNRVRRTLSDLEDAPVRT